MKASMGVLNLSFMLGSGRCRTLFPQGLKHTRTAWSYSSPSAKALYRQALIHVLRVYIYIYACTHVHILVHILYAPAYHNITHMDELSNNELAQAYTRIHKRPYS